MALGGDLWDDKIKNNLVMYVDVHLVRSATVLNIFSCDVGNGESNGVM
jgi:hypothetical protein